MPNLVWYEGFRLYLPKKSTKSTPNPIHEYAVKLLTLVLTS